MAQKRYVFIVEWFDTQSSVVKKFNFIYYLPSHEIQIYDLKQKKTFLKRIKYPEVTLKDLHIGSVFTCFNRQYKVIDYAEEFTRKEIEPKDERTYGMIKPNAYLNIGKIIAAAEQQFEIGNIKMFRMRKEDAEQFYGQHNGKSFFKDLIEFMTSDFAVGMELISGNAVKKWRTLLGPTNSLTAKKEAPQSLRSLYGIDGTKNACHGSDATETANRQLSFVFSRQSALKSWPVLNNCTLCVIKPHAIKEKHIGEIVDHILTAGFEISAMQMFWLDKQTSKQFFEVYEFLPEYMKIVEHMLSGPVVALEVRHDNPVEPFRQVCGPFDPAIAKQIRPNSIRARFGHDRIRNAVHCTDLPEDGPLQVQYFFDTLANL